MLVMDAVLELGLINVLPMLRIANQSENEIVTELWLGHFRGVHDREQRNDLAMGNETKCVPRKAFLWYRPGEFESRREEILCA